MGFWSVRRKWKEQGRSASFPSDSVKVRAPPITKQLAKLTVFGLEDCLFWACAGGSYFLGLSACSSHNAVATQSSTTQPRDVAAFIFG